MYRKVGGAIRTVVSSLTIILTNVSFIFGHLRLLVLLGKTFQRRYERMQTNFELH